MPGGEPISLPAFYKDFTHYYPRCELQTKRWMGEQLKEDWVCLDVGANIGYHSILMSRLAHKGLVYSFEPTITSRMLRKNLAFNDCANVEVIEQAVGNVSGNSKDALYRIWGRKPEKKSYSFTTIDDFVKSRGLARVDLIKVDVDGFDVEVLEGARETLAGLTPIVLVELNHALSTRNRSNAEAFRLLLAAKYDKCVILDSDNYVFRSTWKLGQPWPQAVEVSIDDRDPTDDMTPISVGDSIAKIQRGWELHNSALRDEEGTVTISGRAWGYAMSLAIKGRHGSGFGIVLDLEVLSGEGGVFLSDDRGNQIIGREIFARCGSSHLVLDISDPRVTQVIVRKTTPETLRFRVNSCAVHPIRYQSSSPRRMLDQFNSSELVQLTSEDFSPNWNTPPLSKIRITTPEDLNLELGVTLPLAPSLSTVSPGDRRMEREDAPVLSYLFSQLNPSRHLEIGTWEGFGTALCLQSCNAEIWTLNLEKGESSDSTPVYPTSREPFHPMNPGTPGGFSDGGSTVGWMYRATGLEARVHQLLGDSRNIRDQPLPTEGFDTVLIDGSHSREVVGKDIDNCLELIQREGWIILHDFTLDPSVARAQTSTHGVLAAIADRIEELSSRFDLLWIAGSMLLVLKPHQAEVLPRL